jgi:hypothetical protein
MSTLKGLRQSFAIAKFGAAIGRAPLPPFLARNPFRVGKNFFAQLPGS